MDPNAAWETLLDAIAQGEEEAAADAAAALADWVRIGGFLPDAFLAATSAVKKAKAGRGQVAVIQVSEAVNLALRGATLLYVALRARAK